MDKVFSNFSIYDSFAYLLVGAMFILVAGFDAHDFFQLNFVTADFFSATAVVVVAYFVDIPLSPFSRDGIHPQ
jgi:hypothetical protein